MTRGRGNFVLETQTSAEQVGYTYRGQRGDQKVL